MTFFLNMFDEKVIILVTMFISTMCFAIIPKRLVRPRDASSPAWKTALTLMNCFSGGVFIAACLLDLFPDVRESIDKVLDEIENQYHTKVDYPMAEFIIVMGLLLILIVEQTVLYYREVGLFGSSTEEERQSLINAHDNTDHGTFHEHDDREQRPPPHQGDSDGHDHHQHFDVLEHSTLRSIILLIALSFHSLFEGLAIGLQQVSGQLISIFTAVIVHKAIMAFALGLNMAQSRLSWRSFLISVFIFSIASPIGMGMGIALTDLKQSLGRDIANGVLQGLSGGTFLYITFFEVLPHEMNNSQLRLPKVVAVILGFACICALLFVTH